MSDQTTQRLRAFVRKVRRLERDRIARALEHEASITPCDEDAHVIRSDAALVRAGFSYAAAFDGEPTHA